MKVLWSTGLVLRRLEVYEMSRKILLLEDNVQASNVVKDYFTKKAFEVAVAYDGTTGFKMLQKDTFDIILLDVMMPGMDGFTFCAKVRENMNIPIIMLTGLGDEENMLRGYDLGADDYVSKPFSLAVYVKNSKIYPQWD